MNKGSWKGIEAGKEQEWGRTGPTFKKFEKSLSTRQPSLLNTMGRAVLINSVLDSKLIYVMSSMQVPPGVLQQIDKLRRAFLWTGEPNTSSSKCLVAWQIVSATKELGGLGIKDLGTHNICHLLKLIHRLHCATSSTWRYGSGSRQTWQP
jgi:uncharacterized protein (UPF0371 family)